MATVVDTSSIQMTNCLSQRIHDYDMTSTFAIINRGIGGEPGPWVNRTITKPKNFVTLVSQYQTSTDICIVDIFHTVDSAENSQAIIYQSYNLAIIVLGQQLLSLCVITSRFWTHNIILPVSHQAQSIRLKPGVSCGQAYTCGLVINAVCN